MIETTPDPSHGVESAEIARARLAAIVESSDDIIVSKTLDGIITSWNPTSERVFGWTAAEAVGQSIMLIVPEDRQAEEEGVLARIRRGERVDHFETVRRTKDGRELDVSITVSPIRDAAGHIVGASKVARDITERRRLDEQRAQLLAREQAARQQAEALSNAKDDLLATVSHELRTPLNSILGWARVIQGGQLDEKGHEQAVNAILRNAMAQTRLIEDLLDMSRLTSGRMRLQFERMELRTAIEAALETVRPAARAKDITIVDTVDSSLGTMAGAPDRLQQVAWNLLTNAVKFTPSGGRIDVSAQRRGNTASIVITDTGQGIDADLLPHIFEPFLQGDSSARRTTTGLGLGLALARRLVELHGGRLTAESPGVGRGATFTVTLPLSPTGVRPEIPEVGATPDPGSRTLEGLRVLIVDDNVDFLDVAALILRQAGAEVRPASSTAQAQEVTRSWIPHVLLTDLAMPTQGGFDLIDSMQALLAERKAHASIVVVTADGTPQTRARARRIGVDLYLTKPVDPPDLVTAVADVVRRGASL